MLLQQESVHGLGGMKPCFVGQASAAKSHSVWPQKLQSARLLSDAGTAGSAELPPHRHHSWWNLCAGAWLVNAQVVAYRNACITPLLSLDVLAAELAGGFTPTGNSCFSMQVPASSPHLLRSRFMATG